METNEAAGAGVNAVNQAVTVIPNPVVNPGPGQPPTAPGSGSSSPGNHASGNSPQVTAASAAAAIVQINQAVSSLPGVGPLLASVKASTLRVRTGAEPEIAEMADLCASDARFAVTGCDAQKMRADLAVTSNLASVISAVKVALNSLEDTSLAVLSDAYQQALKIYSQAQIFAKTDPVIEVRIAGMAAFLSHKPSSKSSGKTKKAKAATQSGNAQPGSAAQAGANAGATPVTVTTVTSQPSPAPITVAPATQAVAMKTSDRRSVPRHAN